MTPFVFFCYFINIFIYLFLSRKSRHSLSFFPQSYALQQTLLSQFEGQRTEVLPLLTYCKKDPNRVTKRTQKPLLLNAQKNLKQIFKHSHSHPVIDEG